MPALAGAVISAVIATVYWAGLRSRGGWRAVNSARRNQNPALAWADLATIERGWFYGVVGWGAVSFICLVIAVAVLVTEGA